MIFKGAEVVRMSFEEPAWASLVNNRYPENAIKDPRTTLHSIFRTSLSNPEDPVWERGGGRNQKEIDELELQLTIRFHP